MLYRFSWHVLFERNSTAHLFHHALVNGHVLTGKPSANQTLLYSTKGVLDLEKCVVSRYALRLPILGTEMNVLVHEVEHIPCHDITQLGNADTIAAFVVQTNG